MIASPEGPRNTPPPQPHPWSKAYSAVGPTKKSISSVIHEFAFVLQGTTVGRLGRLRSTRAGAPKTEASPAQWKTDFQQTYDVSQEAWDTQNSLSVNVADSGREPSGVVRLLEVHFCPAFALDYTSPAAQNAFSYQKVTTNPLWEAHKGRTAERFSWKFSPRVKVTGIFLNHRVRTTLFWEEPPCFKSSYSFGPSQRRN